MTRTLGQTALGSYAVGDGYASSRRPAADGKMFVKGLYHGAVVTAIAAGYALLGKMAPGGGSYPSSTIHRASQGWSQSTSLSRSPRRYMASITILSSVGQIISCPASGTPESMRITGMGSLVPKTDRAPELDQRTAPPPGSRRPNVPGRLRRDPGVQTCIRRV